MGVALDSPSTINYQRPFFGSTLSWVGKTEEAIVAASSAVLNDVKALIDPAQKERILLEQNSVTAVTSGVDSVFSSVGSAARAVADATGRVVAPITSNLRLVLYAILALVAVYFFMQAKPFLPSGGK